MKMNRYTKRAFVFTISSLFLAGSILSGCGNTAPDDGDGTTAAVSSETAERESESTTSTDQEPESASKKVFAMDTYMTITCYGDQCQEAVDASVAEIKRLEQLLSVSSDESEIASLNQQGSVTFSDDTADIVEEALSLYSETDGAFDITVYPLMELWGFTTDNFRVPDQTEIDQILPHVNSSLLSYDAENKTMALNDAEGIDLGGIAKGFTSDRLMEIFEEYDLVSGMVCLGGNVECYSTKPDGTQWKCGIQDPLYPDEGNTIMGGILVSDEAVITSGAYERYFTVDSETGEVTGAYKNQNIQSSESSDQETYHHIIDPKTGYPAQTGILSVTIVSDSGLLADGLSTSCYVMGLDKSIDYWRNHADDFGFVIMTEDQEVYVTENISDRFTTDYPLFVVTMEGIDD